MKVRIHQFGSYSTVSGSVCICGGRGCFHEGRINFFFHSRDRVVLVLVLVLVVVVMMLVMMLFGVAVRTIGSFVAVVA